LTGKNLKIFRQTKIVSSSIFPATMLIFQSLKTSKGCQWIWQPFGNNLRVQACSSNHCSISTDLDSYRVISRFANSTVSNGSILATRFLAFRRKNNIRQLSSINSCELLADPSFCLGEFVIMKHANMPWDD
jgi:hypothetical protein